MYYLLFFHFLLGSRNNLDYKLNQEYIYHLKENTQHYKHYIGYIYKLGMLKDNFEYMCNFLHEFGTIQTHLNIPNIGNSSKKSIHLGI
jgi:hypothetical protein